MKGGNTRVVVCGRKLNTSPSFDEPNERVLFVLRVVVKTPEEARTSLTGHVPEQASTAFALPSPG